MTLGRYVDTLESFSGGLDSSVRPYPAPGYLFGALEWPDLTVSQ